MFLLQVCDGMRTDAGVFSPWSPVLLGRSRRVLRSGIEGERVPGDRRFAHRQYDSTIYLVYWQEDAKLFAMPDANSPKLEIGLL